MRSSSHPMTCIKGDSAQKSPAGKKTHRERRQANRGASAPPSESDDCRSVDEAVDEFLYVHRKQRVLTTALFMWERVAAFSPPSQVAELERVSRDVSEHLKESNTGTNLMQRYWNAQWCRMVWVEGELPVEKRFLAPKMLTRSEGKRDWKKVFVEEYPLYLQRTYRGVGVSNNALNDANVLFSRTVLNPQKSATEMKQLEVPASETVKGGHQGHSSHVPPAGSKISVTVSASPAHSQSNRAAKEERMKHEKGRPRAVEKAPSEQYTRSDYQQDYRTGDRKNKHKKGASKRWSNFDNFGDYDY